MNLKNKGAELSSVMQRKQLSLSKEIVNERILFIYYK